MAKTMYSINTRANPAFFEVDTSASPEFPNYPTLASFPAAASVPFTLAAADDTQTLYASLYGQWVPIVSTP